VFIETAARYSPAPVLIRRLVLRIDLASGNPPGCGRGMIMAIELFACYRIHSPRRSDLMRTLIRRARWIAGFAVACLAGSLPSCASMGGGGMKYLVSPPFMESAST
jgi:hypothetical protein